MNLREKKLFLLDMDGTLYLDETLFPSVPEFLSHIRDAGGRYLFLTNNSSRGAADYVEKLRRLAEKYPDQIVKKDRQTFTVPKRCVSVREPYSAERRKAASERAKAAGYKPPVTKAGGK